MPRIFLYLSVIQAVGSSPSCPPSSGDMFDKMVHHPGLEPGTRPSQGLIISSFTSGALLEIIAIDEVCLHLLIFFQAKLVVPVGFAPTTLPLSRERSTNNELRDEIGLFTTTFVYFIVPRFQGF